MSDTPTDFAFTHNPLRVAIELTPGEQDFLDDPRCVVERLMLGSGKLISQAMVQVFGGDIFTDPPGREAWLDPGVVLAGGYRNGFGPFIGPDQEIVIYRDRGDAGEGESDVEILFSGYCSSPRYDERGATSFASRGGKMTSSRSFSLLVRGMLERCSTEPVCQIVGRVVRSAAAQDNLDGSQGRDDETPIGDGGDLWVSETLKTAFNAGGFPNRAAAPVTVSIDGEDELIHVFAADMDRTAKPWTVAQALRHLVYCYLMTAADGNSDEMSRVIKAGNVFSATREMAALSSASRPTPPVVEQDALAFAMLAEPRDLDFLGMNFPEALILLADSAQFRFAVRTEDAGAGQPINRIYISAPGTGEEKTLAKESNPIVSTRSASKILEANNIRDLSLTAIYDDVTTLPVVEGDIRRYEATLELIPGWLPDSNLDDVADAEAAAAYAEAHWDLSDADELASDPWFARYHKAGASFANYASVGRRWVLNETGRYRSADYERSAGPYDGDAYSPWEPTDAEITDTRISEGGVIEVAVADGEWSRLPRPLKPCFSADADGRSLGIVVEFSFDSGATWHVVPEARIMNLPDEAGIYLDSDDLTTLAITGDPVREPDTLYFWKALFTNVARIRATAVIEGDAKVAPSFTDLDYFPSLAFDTSRIFDVSGRHHSNRRDGGNSVLGAAELPVTAEEGDDLAELQAMAQGVLDLLCGRQNVAAAVVPWLTTNFQVLDTVSRIEGMGVELLSHGAGRAIRRTDIVAIEYLGSNTRLILDDERLLSQVEF